MITPPLPRFYYHWSLPDFVKRYALLIDGLPTTVLLAAAAAGAAAGATAAAGAGSDAAAAGDGGGGAATAVGDGGGGGAGNMPLSSSHEGGPRPEGGVEAARLRRREDYELFYQWYAYALSYPRPLPSTHPIITSYHHTVSTHSLDTSYQLNTS